MTRRQKLEALNAAMHTAGRISDTETAHSNADHILLETIAVLVEGTGWHDIVDEITDAYNSVTERHPDGRKRQ